MLMFVGLATNPSWIQVHLSPSLYPLFRRGRKSSHLGYRYTSPPPYTIIFIPQRSELEDILDTGTPLPLPTPPSLFHRGRNSKTSWIQVHLSPSLHHHLYSTEVGTQASPAKCDFIIPLKPLIHIFDNSTMNFVPSRHF